MSDPSRSARRSDTPPKAARVLADSLRSLGIEGRARLTFSASDSLRDVVESGVRMRHPEYDEARVQLAFLRVWLGKDLFRTVRPGVEITP